MRNKTSFRDFDFDNQYASYKEYFHDVNISKRVKKLISINIKRRKSVDRSTFEISLDMYVILKTGYVLKNCPHRECDFEFYEEIQHDIIGPYKTLEEAKASELNLISTCKLLYFKNCVKYLRFEVKELLTNSFPI